VWSKGKLVEKKKIIRPDDDAMDVDTEVVKDEKQIVETYGKYMEAFNTIRDEFVKIITSEQITDLTKIEEMSYKFAKEKINLLDGFIDALSKDGFIVSMNKTEGVDEIIEFKEDLIQTIVLGSDNMEAVDFLLCYTKEYNMGSEYKVDPFLVKENEEKYIDEMKSTKANTEINDNDDLIVEKAIKKTKLANEIETIIRKKKRRKLISLPAIPIYRDMRALKTYVLGHKIDKNKKDYASLYKDLENFINGFMQRFTSDVQGQYGDQLFFDFMAILDNYIDGLYDITGNTAYKNVLSEDINKIIIQYYKVREFKFDPKKNEIDKMQHIYGRKKFKDIIKNKLINSLSSEKESVFKIEKYKDFIFNEFESCRFDSFLKVELKTDTNQFFKGLIDTTEKIKKMDTNSDEKKIAIKQLVYDYIKLVFYWENFIKEIGSSDITLDYVNKYLKEAVKIQFYNSAIRYGFCQFLKEEMVKRNYVPDNEPKNLKVIKIFDKNFFSFVKFFRIGKNIYTSDLFKSILKMIEDEMVNIGQSYSINTDCITFLDSFIVLADNLITLTFVDKDSKKYEQDKITNDCLNLLNDYYINLEIINKRYKKLIENKEHASNVLIMKTADKLYKAEKIYVGKYDETVKKMTDIDEKMKVFIALQRMKFLTIKKENVLFRFKLFQGDSNEMVFEEAYKLATNEMDIEMENLQKKTNYELEFGFYSSFFGQDKLNLLSQLLKETGSSLKVEEFLCVNIADIMKCANKMFEDSKGVFENIQDTIDSYKFGKHVLILDLFGNKLQIQLNMIKTSVEAVYSPLYTKY
jgi:hypothetical protein